MAEWPRAKHMYLPSAARVQIAVPIRGDSRISLPRRRRRRRSVTFVFLLVVTFPSSRGDRQSFELPGREKRTGLGGESFAALAGVSWSWPCFVLSST